MLVHRNLIHQMLYFHISSWPFVSLVDFRSYTLHSGTLVVHRYLLLTLTVLLYLLEGCESED